MASFRSKMKGFVADVALAIGGMAGAPTAPTQESFAPPSRRRQVNTNLPFRMQLKNGKVCVLVETSEGDMEYRSTGAVSAEEFAEAIRSADSSAAERLAEKYRNVPVAIPEYVQEERVRPGVCEHVWLDVIPGYGPGAGLWKQCAKCNVRMAVPSAPRVYPPGTVINDGFVSPSPLASSYVPPQRSYAAEQRVRDLEEENRRLRGNEAKAKLQEFDKAAADAKKASRPERAIIVEE